MVGIKTTATTSTISPYLIIWVIGTFPDPYTMAFGGVETGRMTAAEATRAAVTAGGIGLTPAP